MRILLHFIWKIAVNAFALYIAAYYLNGFIITGGLRSLLLGGLTLAIIHLILRPILRFVSFPLIILSLGLFNIIINIILLLAAAYFLPELSITNFWSLFWGSIIISAANAIF